MNNMLNYLLLIVEEIQIREIKFYQVIDQNYFGLYSFSNRNQNYQKREIFVLYQC